MSGYDPKLKECMRKIEALCREYDCGAYVSLVSQTHGEFRYMLPKWAALSEEKDDTGVTKGIRLRCKKEEKEKAELTAHFIHSGRDTAAVAFSFFDHLVELTKEKWQTEHQPLAGFRPHREEH